MLIIHDLSQIPRLNNSLPPIGLTIGNFDGVHVGHRELLKKIKEECLNLDLLFVVITFVPHPQKILHPEKQQFLINSYDERRSLLKSLGVDVLVEMSFTRDFSTLGPENFLASHLLSYPKLKNFYIGHDFAFGANKAGNYDLVHAICRPRGIKVEIQPKFDFFGTPVSSSVVREKILEGRMTEVESILHRPFHLEGVVIKGEGRGKKIGFPTANIQVSSDLVLPQRGVYATKTSYQNMVYKSVTNIGINPTFNNSNQLHVETNIFDFNVDIYGEQLQILFFQKLREEKKFSTVNDLISQIKVDVSQAKSLFEQT